MAGDSKLPPSFDDAVQLLLTNPPADVFRCAETLFAILKKAAPRQPDGSTVLGDKRHRSLNRDAPTFQQNVGTVKGGVRFLRAAGFIDSAEPKHLTLPDGAEPAHVAKARAALKGAVASLMDAARREADVARSKANEEAARRLIDLKRVQKDNSAKRTALEDAERLRILREMQAERFEKARQEDPHNFC
jgi:hypothetical protein